MNKEIKTDYPYMPELLKLPRYDELPTMGLYMEQLVDYINDKLGPFFSELGVKPLTRSMVNNYVKAKLIAPPENKKYYELSIAMVIVMYVVKTSYSTTDVGDIIALGLTYEDIGKIYNRFCEAIESATAQVFGGNISLNLEDNNSDTNKYVLKNIALSIACKFFTTKCFIEATKH